MSTLFLTPNTLAIDNPIKTPNNKFGIHIHDETDLEDVARLVNSNGGDWGYVTLVIRKDERYLQKWQETFDKMRQLHLIPIVRIATMQKNSYWEKPQLNEIDSWVDFLNSINWVIKNRYVIIGNEPNHANEWGGEVNPDEYSDYLYEFSKKLKEKSNDFFVLAAALDASAPNDSKHMDYEKFTKKLIARHPDIYENIDGLNSHSYPNPNFFGSTKDKRRGSIKTYEWELLLLNELGVKKELPVFITETGWTHSTNKIDVQNQLQNISKNFENAFSDIWEKDVKVVAVTPFILNYQDAPFDIFSWKDKEGRFFEYYYKIQLLPKIKGDPKIKNSLEIKAILTPKILIKDNLRFSLAYAKNTGQAIWEKGNTYQITDGFREYILQAFYPRSIEPFNSGIILISENTNK